MIISGHLLLPRASPERSVRLERGWVRVVDGRLASVETGLCPHTPDLEGEDIVVMPGFIDTHLHLPQFDQIGVHGLELLTWLEQVIFPAEMRWADADFAGEMTTRVAGELQRFGTTAFAGYATVHAAGARAALRALEATGMRAKVGQVLMDCNAPTELVRPSGQLIDEARALVAEFDGAADVAATVNPRFAVTCSAELLESAGELAAASGASVQTHLSENREECATVREMHGAGYVEVYQRAGLLTRQTLLAHGVWLDESDRAALASADAVVAHCPTANFFLQSGVADRGAMQEAGVRVGLGSDVAGGPERSMVRVGQAMVEAARACGGALPTAGQCFYQITAGNADVLGWSDGGRLADGCRADLLVLRPDVRWAEAVDPLGMLLWGWDDRWLERVMVGGQWVKEPKP